MKRYRWTKDVNIESHAYKAGDEIAASDILAGQLESCLRLGWLVPVEDVTTPKKK